MKNTYKSQTKTDFLKFIQLIFAFIILTVAAQAGSFTVTTTNDGLSVNSLREAINAANQTQDATFTININIGAGGVKTITPNSPLPDIEVPNTTTLIIDATTMPGYNGTPLLQLTGGVAGASASGLTIVTGNVIIKGFVINNFSEYGIYMKCPATAVQCNSTAALSVYGSYIGTTIDGSAPFGNKNGIYLQPRKYFNHSFTGASNIGGTGANQRNIISGNDFNGIVINSPDSSNDIKIVNNYIGTNAAGSAAVPNGAEGIYILDTTPYGTVGEPDVFIGGASVSERNVISGNTGNGIKIDYNTTQPYVRGNYIGTNAAGTGDLGNAQNGVLLTESNTGGSTEIGGDLAGEGNIISGNNQNGIKSDSSAIGIHGNRIGTNAAGTAALPNAQNGIYLTKGASIGSNLLTGGNTISGNGGDGIHISDSNFSTLIWGNRIGVNAAGTAPIPNGSDGIYLSGPASIGASGANQYNIISGNTANGIYISSGANGSVIKYNRIGTNGTGADLGNGGDGIRVFGLVYDILIGDRENGGNNIAFNNGDGIFLQPGFGSAVPQTVSMVGNSIYLNDGLGIDLGPTNGVSQNDFGDADAGPNELLNFPILQLASANFINGTFNGAANKYYSIDFYRVDSCDASGSGEGRYYLASGSVQTNANGSGSFTSTGFNLSAGQTIVATTTEGLIGFPSTTSEFSPCLTVTPPPGDVKLNSATYSASESNASVAIIVSRNGGSNGTVTVNYATTDGTATAGQDYTATSGTLTFNHGETGKLLNIPIINDTTDESDETINFTLSNPTGGATLLNPSSAVLTITDNDNPPTVSIKNFSKAETNQGTTSFVFDVNLSEASGFPVEVKWNTSSDSVTATAGIDYTAADGTLNFAPGETSKQISVSVNGDLVVETNEAFLVFLYAPVNTTIADGQAVGTIIDDDSPGKLGFAAAAYNLNESDGATVVTVSRTEGTAGTVTIEYATTNGGTATANTDFATGSGTLTFLDGEITKTFSVLIHDDQTAEQTETINLVLSNPTGGAAISMGTSVINIADNDAPANASIAGTVTYAVTPVNQQQKTVSGIQLSASGASSVSAVTDPNGDYQLENLIPGGNYTVILSKAGDNSGISGIDATMVLRCVAETINCALSANQQKAGDANGNGSLSAIDATMILRYAAAQGATNQTGQVGNWKFLPNSREYQPVNASDSAEDYEAILIGDVSGNWTTSAPGSNALPENQMKIAADFEDAATAEKSNADVEISLPVELPAESSENVLIVPVRLTNYAGRSIAAYSFDVRFDPKILQLDSAMPLEKSGTFSQKMIVISDINQAGRIGIAAAHAGNLNEKLQTGGELLKLRFRIIGTANDLKSRITALTFQQQPIFEDGSGSEITAKRTNGSVSVSIHDNGKSVTGINGRVTTADGKGIRNVLVTLAGENGENRTVLTQAGGEYSFADLMAGETYTVTVISKRFQFGNSSQMRRITAGTEEINFTAGE